MTNVDFFWDVGSPYSYLATTQIASLRDRTGATITFRPFLIGGVFKASGNVMPASVPAKGKYLDIDLGRWARQYGVPLKLPGEVKFPTNSLLAMRVATTLAGEIGERYCHEIMRRYWCEGEDPADSEVVRAALTAIDLQPDDVMATAVTPENKERLKATTADAVAKGAFGAPTFVVGDELFWGNDRLEMLAQHLLGGSGS